MDRQSIRADAYAALKSGIISGTLSPGRLYTIGEVAAGLNVSITPVREALLDLRTLGLVEIVRNRGFRVTEVTDQELDDLLHVRRLLEVPAMQQLADLATPPDLSDARASCERFAAAIGTADTATLLTIDRELHLGLTALLGNQPLTDCISNLRDRSRLFGFENLSAGELGTAAHEHVELVEAISAGDPAAAGDVMTRHLTHVRSDWSGSGRA